MKPLAKTKMQSNFFVAVTIFGLVVLCCNFSNAHLPRYFKDATADNNASDHPIPQFNINYAQLQRHENQEEQRQQQQIYPEQHPILNSVPTSNTTSTSMPSSASPPSANTASAIALNSSLQSAHIYKAEIPTRIEPEAKRVFNATKLASSPSSYLVTPIMEDMSHTSNTINKSNINSETDDDSSKKIIGSSVVTSVSVILNGNKPEFTDALGQKVPKPQPSLQVASPIDLLNPDRYEFYTFDEYGELVKRLMTMEEIQSIVANGDGEGPTIIHPDPIEDRDPEKNVEDIVNSVQSVLNKEVETNKNTSLESLPIFDTPDVSSSWSMILPAIFGNTGNVEIFSNQKPQQVIMTPETEIMETSTMKLVTTSTKNPKPSKRKPGQKRRTTTTTTEITPQIIQEELDSQESVYTGMQQYQNLAATMQTYDGFSQLHIHPIQHKIPEIETSTRLVFINNQEVVKKPAPVAENHDLVLKENLAKKPASVQYKPLTSHRIKKPNGNYTDPKQHQTNKQNTKRKQGTTSTPFVVSTKTTFVSSTAFVTPELSTADTMESTTVELTANTATSTANTFASTTPTTITIPIITTKTATTTTQSQKRKKKKPTRRPVHTTNILSDESTIKSNFIAEKRSPSPKPHRQKPTPIVQHTKYTQTPSAPVLVNEGAAPLKTSSNKLQGTSYHKPRPKPNRPVFTTSTITNTTTAMIPPTTVILEPTLIPTTNNPIDVSVNVQDLPGLPQKESGYGAAFLTTINTTNKLDSTTSVSNRPASGTSGYPVPSYEISIDKSNDSNLNQHTKYSSSVFALDPNVSKPYEEDAFTLMSFDQIMHTLKQPEGMAGNTGQLETVLNKHVFPSQNAMKTGPPSTLKPAYDENTVVDFKALDSVSKSDKISENIVTINGAENDTSKNTNPSNFPSATAFTEALLKETTEYSTLRQEGDIYTQRSETPTSSSTSHIFDQFSLTNGYETITNSNQITKDQLELETRIPVVLPHKESLYNNENPTPHPIFVADLKPHLNMEVIMPSEQIIMSDFQTQAATIASTLVDGANTITSDFIMNSNDTRDKISYPVSDIIHIMPNASDIPETQETSSNDNRYSNQAQLNLSFLMSPIEMTAQKMASTDPNTSDKSNYQQTNKTIYEPIENTKNYDTSTATSIAVEEHANQEFYTGPLEKTTEFSYTTQEEITTNMQPTSTVGQIMTTTFDSVDANVNNATSAVSEANYTTVEDRRKTHPQQQKEDENDVKLEAATILDTTTLTDILTEETTSPSTDDDSSGIKRQEISYDEGTELSDSNTENASVVEYSMNDSQSKINNLLKDYLSEGTSVIAEILTETSKEKFASVTEGLGDFNEMMQQVDSSATTTIIYKDSPFDQQSEMEIADEYEANSTDEVHQNDESTTKFTITEDRMTTLKVDESKEDEETTTINYKMSEEASADLNAISNADGDEDPYIKLGEATTFPPDLMLKIETQATVNGKTSEKKTESEKDAFLLDMPIPIIKQPSNHVENSDQPYEEGDEEDEEDQLSYQVSKLSNPVSGTTITTTSKPQMTTTRRLNTLKPVSYFNKQPVYTLYQKPVEPLYNKQSSQSSFAYQKQNTSPKFAPYTIPTPQQRPMQRPPQLSNLMISATQATRPPVKLDPSPNNSKGLEASLSTLDEDILAFAKMCNELAFSYWKSITSEKISSARSLLISPFALTSMLSMVFLGARGSTSGEMNDVLKLDDMVTFNPHLVFKNITDSVEKSTDVDIATTAFVREIYSDRGNGKVMQFFKEKAQQLYAGHIEEVNFHVVNDIIRRRTNLLVKRHTMGKVFEYLRTNSVWVNGPLATISANLFQTNCSYGSTRDRDGEIFFQVHQTVRQRRLIPIPAVLFKNGFTAGYEPNLDATIIAFGRIQDTTTVIYVMPSHISSVSPSDNLDRLEKQLIETAISENAWSDLLTSLMDRPGMEVQIPRFSHRSFINATLGLQKMGLGGLFKSGYADLGGLTGSSNRDIYLSDMIQINTFSTCGEEKIADQHHVEMYPAPPLRKRNKDVDADDNDELDSSEDIIDFGSLVQQPVVGRGFYDDLLDPKYLELPLPLRPRQARVPDTPRLRFDKPFLYFVRHNPTGILLFTGRFNPRLLP